MALPEQSFAKHRRFIPGFHYFVLPIMLLNVLIVARRMYYQDFSRGGIWDLLVSISLLLLVWYARAMPLTAQDRVIRLEERLRMREKLPADMHAGINNISKGQLVGLRFASDEELPDLARRCINGELKTGGDVKKAVKTWRADHLRV